MSDNELKFYAPPRWSTSGDEQEWCVARISDVLTERDAPERWRLALKSIEMGASILTPEKTRIHSWARAMAQAALHGS